MSIIVGVRKSGFVAMAADSLHCFGTRREEARNLVRVPKVRAVGPYLVGAVGASIFDTLLAEFEETIGELSLEDERQIMRHFVGFWRFLREDYHLVSETSPTEESQFGQIECEFLVAGQNGLFTVDPDFTVMRFSNYCAIGEGSKFAYGALHAVFDSQLAAVEIAAKAAQAATCLDRTCGGEVHTFLLPDAGTA